jgi:hypothetical protein
VNLNHANCFTRLKSHSSMLENEFSQMKSEDASEPVLPPELFPLIARFLARVSKKTLLELLCSNRQIHFLCIPALMRDIDVLDFYCGGDGDHLPAFSQDALGSAKFSHVRSLDIKRSHDCLQQGYLQRFLAAVWVKLTNLASLKCDFSIDLQGLDLPQTLASVNLGLQGTAAERRRIFLALDCLPSLTSLKLRSKDKGHEIVEFPRLLQCLEELTLAVDWDGSKAPNLWAALGHLPKLKILELRFCATSVLASPDVPKIKIVMYACTCDLDESSKQIVAALNGVRVHFDNLYIFSGADEEEEEFSWVTFGEVEGRDPFSNIVVHEFLETKRLW